MKSLLFGFQMFGIQVVTVQVEKREPCGQKNLRGTKKTFQNNYFWRKKLNKNFLGRKVKKSYQQMYFDGNWAKPKYNNVT